MAKAVAKKTEIIDDEVKTTAVAVASNNAVAEYDDEMLAMLNEDAGMGTSTSQDDNIIPLIYILQAQTPQALKQKPEYIKGAEAGNIWPKDTKVLIDGDVGMPVILGAVRKWWVEWKPDRGGLAGKHEYLDQDLRHKGRPSDTSEVKDPKTGKSKWVRENGNELVETREHALLAQLDNEWQPFVVSMKGSDHKTARLWNGDRMRKRHPALGAKIPPCYLYVYNLKTIAKTNELGDWYGWAFENGAGDGAVTLTTSLPNGRELVKMASDLGKAYMSGAKNAAADDLVPDTSASGTITIDNTEYDTSDI